ncbi:hypothetical protein ACR780_04410 [Sphingobacterium faecium]|uniref:hypothetical protein n=1 Tax=Sphingobacterium TaxID=28453 RepID=UPI0025E677DE|nr:hypothetical protein [Sphingobacterium sp. UBA6320]
MKPNDIRLSAWGGTICSIWGSFTFGDLLQTIILAAVGTLVSFVTSRLLGKLTRRK